MKFYRLIVILLLLPSATAWAQRYTIDRVEPTSWWVGMNSEKLQLLVYGPGIADLSPQLDYPGVTIAEVTRVHSSNYLFVDLVIAGDTVPGTVTINFTRGADVISSYAYPLLQRSKVSSKRSGFSAADVIYLITPDRFANGDTGNDSVAVLKESVNRDDPSGRHGGDIQGIINHLDYISAMGFTAIWPTPLLENDQPRHSYHGYAITDHYTIDARFGSNEDFRRLSAQAQQHGIGLIQDIVLNHIGSEHWWMKDLPMPGWLNFEDNYTQTNHSRTTVQDPYAAPDDYRTFVSGWFTPTMPDLNQKNPLLATYLIQNSLWWIEYADLVGVRVDTYSYSDPAFLSEWSRRVMEEYPNFTIVGEEWSSNPLIVSRWQRGKQNRDGYLSSMPSMIDFPLHHAMLEGLVEEEGQNNGLVRMYEMLANDFVYADPAKLVTLSGNHDAPRLFSMLDEDYALYKMAIAYVLTMRGIPQLYYGVEILKTSPKVRDDGAVRSDFPGGWPTDTINAFSGKGLSAQQKEAQRFVRTLLNWRKNATAIHTGKLMHYAPENGVYVYFRYNADQNVMVILNKNHRQPLSTKRFRDRIKGSLSAKDIISGKTIDLSADIVLAPRSVMVLELDK